MNPDTTLAVDIMRLADKLGMTQSALETLIRTPGHPIKEEHAALDQLWSCLPVVQSALRTLGMRLDRGALGLLCDEAE